MNSNEIETEKMIKNPALYYTHDKSILIKYPIDYYNNIHDIELSFIGRTIIGVLDNLIFLHINHSSVSFYVKQS